MIFVLANWIFCMQRKTEFHNYFLEIHQSEFSFVFFCLQMDLLFILGLVRSRDGSRLSPNTQTYMSLPSPNIQSAKVSASIFVTAIRVANEGQNYKSWFTDKFLTAISFFIVVILIAITNFGFDSEWN